MKDFCLNPKSLSLFILFICDYFPFGISGFTGIYPPDHDLHFPIAFVPDAVFLFAFGSGSETDFTDPALFAHLMSDITAGISVAVRQNSRFGPPAGDLLCRNANNGAQKHGYVK